MPAAVGAPGDIAQIMDAMPYGMYIIGSRDRANEPNGMIADWVMQVAFKPRMIAVSFENDAHTLGNIREDGWFTVNFLPATDEGLAAASNFAQPYDGAKVGGRSEDQKAVIHHKMDGVRHAPAAHGSPVLDGAYAWLECYASTFIPAGDHTLVVGEVTDGKLRRSADVLSSGYTGWSYSG